MRMVRLCRMRVVKTPEGETESLSGETGPLRYMVLKDDQSGLSLFLVEHDKAGHVEPKKPPEDALA